MAQLLVYPIDCAPAATVLVVEDETMIRMAIAEDLRACGFEVWESASASAAIEVLEGTTIDVVFSDVHMPGHINGLGLARWILAHQPQVKVILTSAAFSSGDLPGELSQAARMVAKPYELSEVLQQIRLCLDRAIEPRRSGRGEPRLRQRPLHLRALP